jgi:apolipoprotein N-acyltransferase
MVASFPPYRWGFLVVAALALLFWELRTGEHPAITGWVFGFAFLAGLVWWVSELGLIAIVPLVGVFSLHFLLYGWLLGKTRKWSPGCWWVAAVGGWALLEVVRVRFPVGGFEWGLAGYPMSEYAWARGAAQWIGTTGWGVVLAATAAGVVVATEKRRVVGWLWGPILGAVGLLIGGAVAPALATGPEVRVAIVQGSTPCPLTHCPDERFLTYQQHLELTKSIPAGSVDLVVWSEGSTGSLNADPVLHPEIGAAIGAEAARIGSYFLVGSDRPISETHWINANVVFGPDGEIVGEYRKRHPVPFGEYIPARPLFDWISALSAVPRDMIRGEEVVLFDIGRGTMGSVISFEGAFARYARQNIGLGGQLLVVATNEGSYEFTSVSDQFIGMTRMRAAEIGVDVVHSAVTGKSTFITAGGRVGETTGFTDETVITGTLRMRDDGPTLYVMAGEWVQTLAVAGLLIATLRRCRSSPGSAPTSPTSPKI